MPNTSSVTPIFADRPLALRENVAFLRANLALTIASLNVTLPAQRTDDEVFELCSQLGIWPAPATRERALRALVWTGPQLLTMFVECPVENRHAFERWQRAVESRDHAAVAYWFSRLGCWPNSPKP